VIACIAVFDRHVFGIHAMEHGANSIGRACARAAVGSGLAANETSEGCLQFAVVLAKATVGCGGGAGDDGE